MSNIVTASKAKQFVHLEGQKDGTSYNINNIVYYLPRTINQLTKLIGNDVVLRGMNIDSEVSTIDNKATVTVDPGVLICDSTLIETTEVSTIDLSNIDTYTSGGCVVLYVQYQYLQTVAVNAVKFGLTFVNKTGKCVDNWDHNKNRLVLEFWNLDTSTKSITVSPESYILIENKEYYRCGYNLNDLTLSKYMLYAINSVGGTSGTSSTGLVSALADKTIAEGDLQVLDDLTVGGYLAVHGDGSQFDGTVTFNQDVHIKDDLQVYGERTLIDSTDTQFGSQTLILDRNEMGSGTKDRFSGINVRRGTLPNAVLYFDETTDKWVIGTDDDYQTIVRADDLNNLTHNNIKDWLSQFTIDFNTLFATKTTDSLAEGNSHLFFNEDRVYDVLLRKLRAGRGITLSQQNNQLLITNTIDWSVASTTTVGGIKVGAHLSITSDGLLSADQQTEENFTSALKTKLENLSEYTHPDTHPATIIVQDSTHRFVTDEQISTWDTAAAYVYTLPIATTDTLGGVKIGDNITSIDGKISVKPATKETYGVVKIGNNLTIDVDGKISAQNSYTHPTFPISTLTLTGSKVFSKIDVTNEGHVDGFEVRELTLNDLGYTTGSTYPEIKSFTATPDTVLIGSTINSVKLIWETNKLIKSQRLDGITVLDPSLRSYTHSIALHSARTYTLIIDDLTTISKDTTVYFKNNRYWGVGKLPTTIDRAFLESLGNTELEDDKSITFTTTSHENDYIWYAYPSRSGTCVFYAGPTEGGFNEPILVNITNLAGYTEPYYVYRSEYSNLEQVTVSTDPNETVISTVTTVGTGTGGDYILPVASSNILGGVKIGDNLNITSDGVLSASAVDNVYPEIKSLNISPDVALIGSTVSSVLLSWETNKDIIKQVFDNNIGELNQVLRQFRHNDSISTDRTYTLTVYDNKTISSLITLKFKNKRYWGTAEESDVINSQFVTTLPSNELEDDKDITFIVDATKDQFIWYAYPKRSGLAEFFVGMAEGGFSDPVEIEVTNDANFTETYYVYKSIQSTLGKVIVSTDPTAVDSMGCFGGSGISTSATYTSLGVIKVGENLDITSDGLLSAIDKVYPEIKSFIISPDVALLGSTVTQVVLSWETNKKINSQYLNNLISLDPNIRTYDIDTTLTSSYTYTLTLDDVSKVSKEATIYFKNKRYWGTSINPDMVNGDFIKSLQNSQIEDNHAITFTVNVNQDELIWFAYPSRSGKTDFYVGLAKGGFIDEPIVINITNENNYMEEYYVYKSNQAYLGDITVSTDVGLLAIADGGILDIPIATRSILGGVQIGDGLEVSPNGVISTHKQGFIKSFNITPRLALLGSTLSSITFNWNVFGEYNTLKINGIDSELSNPFVYNLTLTSDVTYELTLEDDFHTETMESSVTFVNYCMYGNAIIPDQVNDIFLNSLTKKLLETPEFKFNTITLEDEYIWFACPSRFNIRFQTTSGYGGFEDPITIDHTNDVGFTESYNIYRSVQSNLDFCEIEVRI